MWSDIHILSYTRVDENMQSSPKQSIRPNEIAEWYKQAVERGDYLVGHNITAYDLPVILFSNPELVPWVLKTKIIDTYLWCQYVFTSGPMRHSLGLGAWGERFHVPKIEVADHEWEGGNWDRMKERCEQDVHINDLLFKQLKQASRV